MSQYLHPRVRDRRTVGHCICTAPVCLLRCLRAPQAPWLAGETAGENPLRCAVLVPQKLPGCLRSLWAGFGEHAGSSPRLLPPISVQRNSTLLSKCLSSFPLAGGLKGNGAGFVVDAGSGCRRSPALSRVGRGGRGAGSLQATGGVWEQNPAKAPRGAGAAPAPLPGVSHKGELPRHLRWPEGGHSTGTGPAHALCPSVCP